MTYDEATVSVSISKTTISPPEPMGSYPGRLAERGWSYRVNCRRRKAGRGGTRTERGQRDEEGRNQQGVS